MAKDKTIAFVSDMDGAPWGGSEELWSRAAMALAQQGLRVRASVLSWSPPHERVSKLAKAGVDLQFRAPQHSVWSRAWRKAFARNRRSSDIEFVKFLAREQPSLVVICSGGSLPPVNWLEECVARKLPFVTVAQSNSEHFWPSDDVSAQYRKLLPMARQCFFVSDANRRLVEDQVGIALSNFEIVFNPFNVAPRAAPPWPPLAENGELRLACVARLHPPSKGQDLLLRALASDVWRGRNWKLSLYGEGPMRTSIERLAERLGLGERVALAGFVGSIEDVWANNHALVLPSRYEGMPLVMVEAMLCARAVVATDVAGHAELIKEGVTGFLADAPTTISLSSALERLWSRRLDLEAIGRESARVIRQLVPTNPSDVFAQRLNALADGV